MGEDKSNSDNGNKKNKESDKDDMNNQSEKRVLDIIDEQIKKLVGLAALNQTESDTTGTAGTAGTSDNCGINSLAEKVLNINILRFELIRLSLNFSARAYYENDVRPLIDTFTVLSFASSNFSATASNIASTNFGSSSNIKDVLDITDSIDDIAEDLIKVIKCKVDNLIKLAKYDC